MATESGKKTDKSEAKARTAAKPVDEFLRCVAGCKGLEGEALTACIKGCADVIVASPDLKAKLP